MTQAQREPDFSQIVLIRSDQGDGGWSLHWIGDEDQDGVPARILISGVALMGIDEQWDRPDERDYNNALSMLSY